MGTLFGGVTVTLGDRDAGRGEPDGGKKRDGKKRDVELDLLWDRRRKDPGKKGGWEPFSGISIKL